MRTLNIRQFPPLSYACNEAINTLCTNLSFAGTDFRKIMITSCHAAEGKSFLSMNIMRMFAEFGKTVVLVDADMRRSMISTRYMLEYDPSDEKWGLSHILAGMATKEQVLYQTNIAGTYMVPVGQEVSNPLPLLNSPRFAQLLENLAHQADYVLVDAPPVGLVIDAAEIAKNCDGSLIVVNYNAVRRQELIDVKEQLEQTGCPILGTAINMAVCDNYLGKKYYKSYYSRYELHEGELQKNESSRHGNLKRKCHG